MPFLPLFSFWEISTGTFDAQWAVKYILLTGNLIRALCSASRSIMLVALMSFFARISDASMAGTAITLFNTFDNIGGSLLNIIS